MDLWSFILGFATATILLTACAVVGLVVLGKTEMPAKDQKRYGRIAGLPL